MQLSGNFGPGVMLGLISSESYATAVRGTCYGLSSAVGKVGAAIGTQIFLPIQRDHGKRWTFIVAAMAGIAGILITYFFIPDVSGEDLAAEDEKFRRYLVAHGWDGKMGEPDPTAMPDDTEVQGEVVVDEEIVSHHGKIN